MLKFLFVFLIGSFLNSGFSYSSETTGVYLVQYLERVCHRMEYKKQTEEGKEITDHDIECFNGHAVPHGTALKITETFYDDGKTWGKFKCKRSEGYMHDSPDCWVDMNYLLSAEKYSPAVVMQEAPASFEPETKKEKASKSNLGKGRIVFISDKKDDLCFVRSNSKNELFETWVKCNVLSGDPKIYRSAAAFERIFSMEDEMIHYNYTIEYSDLLLTADEIAAIPGFAFKKELKTKRAQIEIAKKQHEEKMRRLAEEEEKRIAEWRKQREKEYAKMTPEERAQAIEEDEQVCAGDAGPSELTFVDCELDLPKPKITFL